MKSPNRLHALRGDNPEGSKQAGVRIAKDLLEARRQATAMAGFPGAPPRDLPSAYEIQSHLISEWQDEIAGWKVGGIPEGLREKFGAAWLIGPIFAKSIKRSSGSGVTQMPVFRGGFAAIESELVIELGPTRGEDRMYVGVEIASSPVPEINDYGPTAVVSDFGNNNGLLVGEEIKDWTNLREPIEVATWIDGQLVGERLIDDVFASALSARNFALNLCEQLGRQMPVGTLVSTGALTGIHEAQSGAHGKISFSGSRSVELELVDATRSF